MKKLIILLITSLFLVSCSVEHQPALRKHNYNDPTHPQKAKKYGKHQQYKNQQYKG